MDKVAGKVVRTVADWAELVRACERSGQSAAGFCRGQGIAYPLFLYHRRKMLKIRSGIRSVARVGAYTPATRSGGFIPVRIEGVSGMRLKFPMGLVLESEQILPASWVVEMARRWAGAEDVSC